MPQSGNSVNNTMVYGPDKKLGIIRDTSIQPFVPKEETFDIEIPKTVKVATIEVSLSYQLRPGDVYSIQKTIRKVPVDDSPY